MAKRSLPFNPDSPPPKNKKDQEEPISPNKLTTTDNHATVSGFVSTLSPLQPNREPISPSKLTTTDNHSTVSGLLSTLSPLQPNRYFHGELTDGEAIMRVVGFDKTKLEKLRPYYEYQVPVTLRDCVIQRNKKGNLEIVLTKIEQSTLSFEISDPKTAGSVVVTLEELSSLPEHTRVTIRATVIRVHESQNVGKRRIMKQDVTIADSTATATLTLWDKNVGILQPNVSYQFNRLVTCSYMGKAYLSFPLVVSFDIIDPINGLCTNDYASSSDEEEDLTSASIIGLKDLETYYACINRSKTVTPNDQHIGVCNNCNITQKLTSKQTARLIVKSGAAKISLKAYDDVIKVIAQSNTLEVSAQELLFAPMFDCSYNKYHVITKISRK